MLEELLNKLIEKGWKVFWDDKINKIKYIEHEWRLKYVFFSETSSFCRTYSIREISSMSSWLWQFVCENGMIKNEKLTHNWVSQIEWGLDVDCKRKITPKGYQYRLIESALCDEDKLESFILENIKL